MKCLVIADMFIPQCIFDDALKSCDLFDEYKSIEWQVNTGRTNWRNMVRKLETCGYTAFEPSKEMYDAITHADVLIVHQHPVPATLMDAAVNLKYILTVRGGVENIDVEAAKKRDIVVINCPTHNAIAVAEYTLGLMVCETRNITRADRALREGTWRENYPNSARIEELCDTTVGLIGFGTIGALVADRLQSFGSRIVAYDPYVGKEAMKRHNVEKVELETLLKTSDIVSMHGRIETGASPVIGEKELNMMKTSSYLINTARAALVDMEALKRALKGKKIMGAAIDVFVKEPLKDNDSLLGIDSITITNHRGGDTYGSYANAPLLLVEQFREYLKTGNTKFKVC